MAQCMNIRKKEQIAAGWRINRCPVAREQCSRMEQGGDWCAQKHFSRIFLQIFCEIAPGQLRGASKQLQGAIEIKEE
jgi:hypothetical protein